MNIYMKGFTVGNYKSFDSLQTISFATSRIMRHPTHVIKADNHKLLKSAIVFGANASGKSNLINAMRFSTQIIIYDLDHVNLINKNFRINSSRYKAPAIFQYDFIVNGQEYLYGFTLSYEKQIITNEWLTKVNENKEDCIFDRQIDDHFNSTVYSDYKKNVKFQIYLDDFNNQITESLRKKTILSDISNRAQKKDDPIDIISNIYNYICNMIIIYPGSKYNKINEIGTSDKEKAFFEEIVQYFDTGIESLDSEEKEMDLDKLFSKLDEEKIEEAKIIFSKTASNMPITLRINNQIINIKRDENGQLIYHKLLTNHGNPNDLFELSDESDGTKRLFDLIPLLQLDNKPRMILIDEIDRSLHTNLVRQFIELFFESSENKNIQLLATTQDSNILDLKLLRQDEIWFVERSHDHSSKIFSLNKFKERFDKNIQKEYLLGRYGAIPIFRDSFLDDYGYKNDE